MKVAVSTSRVAAPKVPGIAFTRFVAARILGDAVPGEALRLAERWHDTPQVGRALRMIENTGGLDRLVKAAVAPATTDNPTWAGPLAEYSVMADEFLDLARAATIVGRIEGIRQVPFNIKVPRFTAPAGVSWVGQGSVKPLSYGALDQASVDHMKVVGLVVVTEELLRLSTPSAELILRDHLIASLAELIDRDFIDPSSPGEGKTSPASITYGVTPIAASGETASAAQADLAALAAAFFDANPSSSDAVILMRERQAFALSLLRDSGGAIFPALGAQGGAIGGIPVITSENIPATGGSPADGFPIAMVKASDILLADDGEVIFEKSRQSALQMESAPDSPQTAATVVVPLFQMNMVALAVERFITWKKARSGAVQYIAGAKYGL